MFIEGHFTWKIGSLVTAGKVGNSLVTAGGRPGYGRKQCLGMGNELINESARCGCDTR